MSNENLIELAERAEAAAMVEIGYALHPPGGYDGRAERRAAYEWLSIAAALRSRAAMAGRG